MKKLVYLLTLLATVSAQANCIPVYQDRIVDIDIEIEQRKKDENIVAKATRKGGPLIPMSGFLGAGLTGIEVAKAVGTSVVGGGASTAAGAGVLIGLPITAYIIKKLSDANIEQLYDSKSSATSALSVLREAEAQDGEHLRLILSRAAAQGLNYVSLLDISDSINRLSDNNEFCMNEELDNYYDIEEKVLLDLKN